METLNCNSWLFGLFLLLSIEEIIVGLSAVEFEEAAVAEISSSNNEPAAAVSYKTKFRVPPKRFHGPDHFKFYSEFCMKTSIDAAYTYTVCPFHNVTQLDNTVSDATAVAIGSWQGWLIENNTYIGWHFYAGDPCDGKSREAKVLFHCGAQNILTAVKESERCLYEIRMSGPTFCNPDALLVYPHLSDSAKHNLDIVETQRARNLITKEAYNGLVELVLTKEGLLLNENVKDLYHAILSKEQPKKFDSRETCEKEFNMIKKENDILRSMTSKESLQALESEMEAMKSREESMEADRHLDADYLHYEARGMGDL